MRASLLLSSRSQHIRRALLRLGGLRRLRVCRGTLGLLAWPRARVWVLLLHLRVTRVRVML